MLNKELLENRLNRIVNLYDNLDSLIDKLPVKLPNGAKNQIKKIIFGNKEISEIISGLKERRPPD
ncbi:hypothetical protein [Priestia megaterium]|uniref:hypothetical protein n=1 Tax=Priestia megaterium TaxID=1404 RepID=UPI001E34C0F8|nr:hypothetical protein [Priestia megaterium]